MASRLMSTLERLLTKCWRVFFRRKLVRYAKVGTEDLRQVILHAEQAEELSSGQYQSQIEALKHAVAAEASCAGVLPRIAKAAARVRSQAIGRVTPLSKRGWLVSGRLLWWIFPARVVPLGSIGTVRRSTRFWRNTDPTEAVRDLTYADPLPDATGWARSETQESQHAMQHGNGLTVDFDDHDVAKEVPIEPNERISKRLPSRTPGRS